MTKWISLHNFLWNGQKTILERIPTLSLGLHYTHIGITETNAVRFYQELDTLEVKLWHDRLGHPDPPMFKKIVENSTGHPLLRGRNLKLPRENFCQACSHGKLLTKLSYLKVEREAPLFLQRIQGDICGPIHPSSGPFRYYMVLIDASSRWSHVCLLSSRNMVFPKTSSPDH